VIKTALFWLVVAACVVPWIILLEMMGIPHTVWWVIGGVIVGVLGTLYAVAWWIDKNWRLW
jgi:hypothetical protein